MFSDKRSVPECRKAALRAGKKLIIDRGCVCFWETDYAVSLNSCMRFLKYELEYTR